MIMEKKNNFENKEQPICIQCEFFDKANDKCERFNFERILDYHMNQCSDFVINEKRIFF